MVVQNIAQRLRPARPERAKKMGLRADSFRPYFFIFSFALAPRGWGNVGTRFFSFFLSRDDAIVASGLDCICIKLGFDSEF